MKRRLILTVLFIGLIFLLFPRSKTPYSGEYTCIGHADYLLILKPDNKFIIYYSFGKSAVDTEGSYTVRKNHIELQYANENSSLFKGFISAGEFYGSDIIFSFSDGSSEVKFEKL